LNPCNQKLQCLLAAAIAWALAWALAAAIAWLCEWLLCLGPRSLHRPCAHALLAFLIAALATFVAFSFESDTTTALFLKTRNRATLGTALLDIVAFPPRLLARGALVIKTSKKRTSSDLAALAVLNALLGG
jgi:hypothetical protein